MTNEYLLKIEIKDLDLSIRAGNVLNRAGIKTVKQLINRREKELENIRNMGSKTMREIIDKVEELGLNFKIDECIYCKDTSCNSFSSNQYITDNYKIGCIVNIEISIEDKANNSVIDIKNIKESKIIKYCPICGKRL